MTRKVEEPAVEAVPLDRLHPAPWNPRTIKDERFQNLVRSIQTDPDFLWRRPILATADGTIYAGNMRYRAAQHLGMATVPAVVEDIAEQLAKERALRDNHQWGEWAEDDLAKMLEELRADGADLELLGFTGKELAKLLDEVGVGVGEAEDEFAYHERFGVTVICKDASEQERVYDELRQQGYECRVVVV
jgi:ParB-like chromosome segregation protein Spo0J